MIWIILFLILVGIVIYLDVAYDFSKELGVIWYTFNQKRKCIVLWGKKC